MNELVARDLAEAADVAERALALGAPRLADARSLVHDAGAVRFVALGSSRHAAGYGAEVLGQLTGCPAMVAPAPGWGTGEVAWRDGELAVVVTQSGRTPALVETVTRARQQGVTVVALVNATDSPLHDLAHLVVPLEAGDERVVAATKSVTAEHVVLRALAGEVDTAAVVGAVRAGLTADIGPAVQGERPTAVVCGGIAGEWIAAEIALKVAEMLGAFAVGEPLVDFLHGPIAAEGAVLALAPDGDPNIRPLLLRPETVVGSPAGTHFSVPDTGDDTLDPIVRLVVGQRIVLAWADHLGIDADHPRGMSKVTDSH